MSRELQKKKPDLIHNEMKPLEDYLTGKSTTTEFIDECRRIRETENAEFEVIPDEPLNEKIEWNDLPEDNEAPTLSRNLLDEAGLWEDKIKNGKA